MKYERPCVVCGNGPCDSAHVTIDGVSRKAAAKWTVPLCSARCSPLQTHGGWSAIGMTRDQAKAKALEVEADWQAILAARAAR